jgi:hypothetical protein
MQNRTLEISTSPNGRLNKDVTYYSWIKEFKAMQTRNGLTYVFRNVGIYMLSPPCAQPCLRDFWSDPLHPTIPMPDEVYKAKERYNKDYMEYQRECGKATKLIESHVDPTIWKRVSTSVSNFEIPDAAKIEEIMSFLRTNYGGIFTPARYEANMAKVANIPHFVTISDYYNGMDTYRSLAEERNFWQTDIPRPPGVQGPYDHNRLSAVLWLRSRIVRDDMKAFRMKLSTMNDISFEDAVNLLDTEIKAIENIDEENGLVLQAQPVQDRIMAASSRPAFIPNRSQFQQPGQTVDNRMCNNCKQVGHISRFCPNPQIQSSDSQRSTVPFQRNAGSFVQRNGTAFTDSRT